VSGDPTRQILQKSEILAEAPRVYFALVSRWSGLKPFCLFPEVSALPLFVTTKHERTDISIAA